MRSRLFLALLLLCTGCRGANQPPSPIHLCPPRPTDPDLQLSAHILRTHQPPLLAITLRNKSRRAFAVLTGINLGGVTPYPAAAFQFTLEHADHTRSTLYCGGCEPAAIFGFFSPYVVYLNPSEQQTFIIQLDSLYTLAPGTQHTLSVGSDPGARILVSLQGARTEGASWVGQAETSTPTS